MKKIKLIFWLIVLVVLCVFAFFITRLEFFEQNSPEILVQELIYSDGKKPIAIHVKDDQSGIEEVKIFITKENNASKTLLAEEKGEGRKELTFELKVPKSSYKEKSFILEIHAKDSSLFGNETSKKTKIIVDTRRPILSILSNSYQIEQGGAASVVFGVKDENLDEIFIETDKGRIFKAQPFVKDGYYAALIAWDAKENEFRAFVVAKDKAGNISKERIRYYFTNRKYRNSNIKLSDRFLDGKIEELAEIYAPQDQELTRLEKFKFVNETLRLGNEEILHKLSSQLDNTMIDKIKLNLFLPMRNAMKVADFADHRFYSYEGQEVSQSYHMGLDLASIAQDKIYSNNAGKVVFAEENGIYGLSLLIDHGFGIYTLYGHCTDKFVEVGDEVKAGQVVATTGVSGLALGDHLHFGVLVQGVETRPEQWQDRKWIENNIYKVLDEGKKLIIGTGQ